MIKYAIAAMILLVAPAAQAQHDHPMGEAHAAHGGMAAQQPAVAHEPGQAAFAAIQEIVGILAADPKTDWSKVDIDALRRHLVDMNNVTLYAKAKSVPLNDGMRFEVSGDGDVRASIRRMVSAHAVTMNGSGGWTYQAKVIPSGAAMTVTVANPADLAKLRGLGFFGVLALGMHHPTHHLMIASGHAPHQ